MILYLLLVREYCYATYSKYDFMLDDRKLVEKKVRDDPVIGANKKRVTHVNFQNNEDLLEMRKQMEEKYKEEVYNRKRPKLRDHHSYDDPEELERRLEEERRVDEERKRYAEESEIKMKEMNDDIDMKDYVDT